MHEQRSPSFEADIRPLFRDLDVEHMRPLNVFLDDYGFMSKPENATMVLDFLTGKKEPKMPPGGPFWSQEQLDLLARWMDAGYPK
ncbi:MAG: hypothetical protein JO030_06040 [Candidatus Eremiobacteraeota bacterium]|nr:hypothetical protein [Candidatus Eremiobacteraeota bacterium]